MARTCPGRPGRRLRFLLGGCRSFRGLTTWLGGAQDPTAWSGHELAILLDVKPRNMLHRARRMGTPGLLHPHRLRHLQTQHATSRYTLDNPARPLTSRLCSARTRLRRAVDPWPNADPAGLTARARPEAETRSPRGKPPQASPTRKTRRSGEIPRTAPNPTPASKSCVSG